MKALDKTLVSCLAHDALHLIVLPTEASDRRAAPEPGRMEGRVVRGLKNLLTDRAHELRHLTLSWVGAEPLLAGDLVEDVLQHTQILRAKHPSLRVRSDVTTNGHHLGRAAFERLVSLGARRFRVAFGGPTGIGQLNRIWGNLVSLRDVKGDFQVQVRVPVDRESYRAMPAFIDFYAETFGMDERFPLHLGKPRRRGDDEAESRAALGLLRRHAERRGVARLRGLSEARFPHAAEAHAFVVRPDGLVNRCPVVRDGSGNLVGRLHESGRLEFPGGGSDGPPPS